MKTNELKVGDRVKYYTYGFGYKFEYESIITEIKDDIIITGGIRIDKKDIISKLEPLPAQYKEIPLNKEIFNLKVGDLIYYEHESGPIGIYNPTIYKKIQSGHINTIELPYIWTSWQPKESIHPKEKFGQKYGNKIHFSKIVSRGEKVLDNQYKEIKIEQNKIPENHWRCSNPPPKNSIKLSELKIGNKIKYLIKNSKPYYTLEEKYADKLLPFIAQGTINRIYSDSFIVDGNHVSEKYVISKIEGILDPMTSSKAPISYMETPIEKEENPKHSFYCPKCKSGYSINGNFSHIVEQECNNCKNKEKPTPKSFKFDFKVQSTECNYNNSRKRMQCKMTGFGEMKNGRIEEELVLPYDYDLGDINLGKTYAIEIKEKE